jgi:hypothetical protein
MSDARSVGAEATGTVDARIAFARRDVDARLFSKDARTLGALEEHEVRIIDARRPMPEDISLTTAGFALVDHRSKMKSFADTAMLESQYAPELEDLIIALTGAKAAIVFDMVMRGTKELANENPDTRIFEYAFKAHTDSEGQGFLARAEATAPAVAARFRDHHFVEYNVWRPVVPIEQKPLALCDASSVSLDDLMPALYDGYAETPSDKRPNHVTSVNYYHLAHATGQRWYYFSGMTPNEVLLFKQWDTDARQPLCVPHSSFEHPATAADAAPRISIEARVLAFYDRTPSERRLNLHHI